MLSISPKAGEMLDQFASQTEEASELCLRVEIIGRGPKGFQYDLQSVSYTHLTLPTILLV